MMNYGFVLIGLGCLVFFACRAYRSYLALNWPCVTGDITLARIDRSRDMDGGRDHTGVIEFSYRYGKRTYQGRMNVPLQRFGRYEDGGDILVRVNPAKPKQAIVQDGFDWASVFFCLVGAGFMLLGLLVGGGS